MTKSDLERNKKANDKFIHFCSFYKWTFDDVRRCKEIGHITKCGGDVRNCDKPMRRL